MCQCHSLQKCCIKCHRDFSRNLSCKILTFGFTTGKLLQLCFCGLLRSIKVSSRQPLNQFLSIKYFSSFQTLPDKIANFGKNSVFRNSENFHSSDEFCSGVNTYKYLKIGSGAGGMIALWNAKVRKSKAVVVFL